MPGTLLQHVGKVQYRGQDLYYGVSAENRYDDPGRRYGVLYLGKDLATALMESVFHKHDWISDPKRSISMAHISDRLVRAVGVLDRIALCDLTAPGVMAGYFGLNLQQLTQRDYQHTQRISGQVHALKDALGADQYDGILYPPLGTIFPRLASPCSTAPGRKSASSWTSIWLHTSTGRPSFRTIRSVSSPLIMRASTLPRTSESSTSRSLFQHEFDIRITHSRGRGPDNPEHCRGGRQGLRFR